MKANDDVLREAQLEMIGRLMAGLSHEMKNHLAIINELSGLQGDLLAMAESKGRPMDSGRCKKIISDICGRVELAVKATSFLSGFAHRMDTPCSSFNVNDPIRELLHFLQRFASKNEVLLEDNLAEGLPNLYNNPSLLQFAAYCTIYPLLNGLQKNNRILVSTEAYDDAEAVKLGICYDGTLQPTDSTLNEVLQLAADKLAGGKSAREIVSVTGQEISILVLSVSR